MHVEFDVKKHSSKLRLYLRFDPTVKLDRRAFPKMLRRYVAPMPYTRTSLFGRMLAGEMMTSSLDDREVSIGIAARCVFVVAVLGRDPAAARVVDQLRCDVEQMVREARAEFTDSRPRPTGGSGGSSSGPAELPVIEIGVTVRRQDRN